MPWTAHCPHCSRLLSIPDELAGREFACPLCGVLVAPVPLAEPVLPAPAVLDFDDAAEEPLERRPHSYEVDGAEERVEELLPEWNCVWRGLTLMIVAATVLIPVYSLRVLAATVGPRFVPSLIGVLPFVVFGLAVLQLVAVVVHLVGQYRCTALPPKLSGAVRTSCRAAVGVFVLLLAEIVLVFTVPDDSDDANLAITLLTLVVLVLTLVSVLAWLVFLQQLADRLGARDLAARVRGFTAWFWVAFWAQVIFSLLETRAAAQLPRIAPCFALISATITVATFVNYVTLIRSARAAVARRAPVRPLSLDP